MDMSATPPFVNGCEPFARGSDLLVTCHLSLQLAGRLGFYPSRACKQAATQPTFSLPTVQVYPNTSTDAQLGSSSTFGGRSFTVAARIGSSLVTCHSSLLYRHAPLQFFKPIQHHVDLRRSYVFAAFLDHQEALAVGRYVVIGNTSTGSGPIVSLK